MELQFQLQFQLEQLDQLVDVQLEQLHLEFVEYSILAIEHSGSVEQIRRMLGVADTGCGRQARQHDQALDLRERRLEPDEDVWQRQDRGSDRDEPRNQPAEPRRDAEVEKALHHDLSGKRAGKRRVLPGRKQRHREENTGHSDAEQRAQQFVRILNCRHLLVP